jgi:hypothetical protein
MRESDRFYSYCVFFSHETKLYLKISLNRYIKNIVVKFRFGIGLSDLFVHSCRYKNVVNINLVCPLCRQASENEVHFLLCCPSLIDLREKLIPKKYFRNPNSCRMNLLLASNNEETVRNLALYMYKAFIFRQIAIS